MDSIKVSDVAAEAGVHRSTFYRYYHDTYGIYEQIEKEELDAYEKLLREEASHGVIDRDRVELSYIVELCMPILQGMISRKA